MLIKLRVKLSVINRKSKLQTLLTELNSVNRMIDVGALKCAKCGSDEIIFNLDKTTFDISKEDLYKLFFHIG